MAQFGNLQILLLILVATQAHAWNWRFGFLQRTIKVGNEPLGPPIGPDSVPFSDGQYWMSEIYFMMKNRPLNSLFLPGTHGAGAWNLVDPDSCKRTCPAYGLGPDSFQIGWSVTQRGDLYHQFRAGSRYFDVRVARGTTGKYAGKYHFVHCGLSRNPLVDELDKFATEFVNNVGPSSAARINSWTPSGRGTKVISPREVLLIHFHQLYTCAAQGMTQAQHEELMREMVNVFKKKNALSVLASNTTTPKTPLEDIIGQEGHSKILFIYSDNTDPHAWYGNKGVDFSKLPDDIRKYFVPASRFIDRSWPNKNTFDGIADAANSNYRNNRMKSDDKVFVIEGNATPGIDVITNFQSNLLDWVKESQEKITMWSSPRISQVYVPSKSLYSYLKTSGVDPIDALYSQQPRGFVLILDGIQKGYSEMIAQNNLLYYKLHPPFPDFNKTLSLVGFYGDCAGSLNWGICKPSRAETCSNRYPIAKSDYSGGTCPCHCCDGKGTCGAWFDRSRKTSTAPGVPAHGPISTPSHSPAHGPISTPSHSPAPGPKTASPPLPGESSPSSPSVPPAAPEPSLLPPPSPVASSPPPASPNAPPPAPKQSPPPPPSPLASSPPPPQPVASPSPATNSPRASP